MTSSSEPSLTAQKSVEEHAPPSQIPGLNLTQFNEIGTFRSNLLNKIPKRSNRACRAKTYKIKFKQLNSNRPALYHLT